MYFYILDLDTSISKMVMVIIEINNSLYDMSMIREPSHNSTLSVAVASLFLLHSCLQFVRNGIP